MRLLCSRALAAMAVVAVTGACTGRRSPDEAARPTRDVPVVVTNYGWSDADVYAVHLTQRMRLGFVPSQATVTLRIPPVMVTDDEVQLIAHPVGGTSDYQSDVVHVPADQHAVLELQDVLAESSLSVFPDPETP